MKLGELRGLIRKTKGNPIITLASPPGATDSWKLAVMKTPLLEELERIYPGGKATETGLEFNPETGVMWCPLFDEKNGMPLSSPNSEMSARTSGASSVTATDDLDLDIDDDFDLDDLDDDELDLDE